MIVKGLTSILNVSNLAESIAWFEKLGWKKHWDWGNPPTFGAVINEKAEIFLCENCQGSRGGPIPPVPDDDATGGVWMSWWLESPAAVDAAYELALREGITIARPPQDMPWNVHECLICHPDGHTFRLSAGLPEE